MKLCTHTIKIYQGQVACIERHIFSIGEKNPFLSFREQIIKAQKENLSWSVNVNACAITKKSQRQILFLAFDGNLTEQNQPC